MSGPWIKANWKWSNRRWKELTLTFYESVNSNRLQWVNSTQMTIISTNVGKNPLEQWSSHHSHRESEMQYLDAISKMTEWFLFISKANHIQVYAPTSNAEEAEVEQFYENLQDLELIPKKRCPFHYRGLECKSRKSRNTWSNRQIWLGNTKWSRSKANRVLPRECTGRSKHPVSTTQEKTLHMDISRWSILKLDW